MAIRDGFTDLMMVDEEGKIEYFYVPMPEYYDFRPEELIGTLPQQQYSNLYEEDSTLIKAVRYGMTIKNYPQELVTLEGKRIRQVSDTYCIRNGSDVIGAIEIAYYDKEYSVEKPQKGDYGMKTKLLRFDDIIGSSEEMEELKRKFRKVKDLASPVLLAGETGTGKEMAARIIHSSGRRKTKEFVYVNCGALPENLLEGILFGVKQGSFTDAEDRQGLFVTADKGTLFLDEINAMPLTIQGKILRAIEEKRIRPVGADNEISVDVRVIASCSGEIDDILAQGQIRKDLYFRLAVIRFELPPLRERGDDVFELAEHFIDELNKSTSGKGIRGMDKKTTRFFGKHDWPGNVRELKNTIEGAYFAAEGSILKFSDIESRFAKHEAHRGNTGDTVDDFFDSPMTMKEYVDDKLKELIEASLRRHDGVLKDAARELGLTVQMLRYNMEKFSITD